MKLFLFLISFSAASFAQTYPQYYQQVGGYYRQDGTWVNSYSRRNTNYQHQVRQYQQANTTEGRLQQASDGIVRAFQATQGYQNPYAQPSDTTNNVYGDY